MKSTTVVIGIMIGLASSAFNNLIAQEDDIQKVYQEYMQINMRLQQVQDQAMNDETVAAEADDYSALIDEKVKDAAPDGAELLKRRDDTISKYQQAQMTGNTDEMNRLEEEYTSINTELQPLLDKALNDEDVVEKRDHFEKVLIAKMEEIDPETQVLIDRITMLAQKLEKHFNN
jgi:chromosome segregation ATPase